MNNQRRHIAISFVLCVLVISAGFGTFGLLASLKEEPPRQDVPEKVFNVEVYRVEAADLREIVTGFGSVQAEHDVTYSARIAGQIVWTSPRFKIGEPVAGPAFEDEPDTATGQSRQTSGDLLLTIDPERYQERLVLADNAIVESQTELKQIDREEQNNARLLDKVERDYEVVQREHQRIEALADAGSVTPNELSASLLELQRFEESRITLQNSRDLLPTRRAQVAARLTRLQTDRRLAAIDLAQTEVRPPFSGIVTEVLAERGQYVQPGTPLFRLLQISTVDIAVPLHSSDFLKIARLVQAGEQPLVMIAENEATDARWTGRVVRLSPEADAATRTLSVHVEVTNRTDELPLLPGTFVQTRIVGPRLRNQIPVPREAVLGQDPHRGRVLVAEDGRVKVVPVTVERRLEGTAFITSGLQGGEQVVMTNLDILAAGSRIEIQNERSLDDEMDEEQTLRRAKPEPAQ